jgi:hypothetical protein
MRPFPGAPSSQHSEDPETAAVRLSRSISHVEYQLIHEETIDSTPESLQSWLSRPQDILKQSNLDDTAASSRADKHPDNLKLSPGTNVAHFISDKSVPPPSESSWSGISVEPSLSLSMFGVVSRPMTPIFLGASDPGSISSSAFSRRNSGAASSSSEAESHRPVDGCGEALTLASEGPDSVPQLIMPTLSIPSRRPFTEVGKSLGKLKILLAGSSGIRHR